MRRVWNHWCLVLLSGAVEACPGQSASVTSNYNLLSVQPPSLELDVGETQSLITESTGLAMEARSQNPSVATASKVRDVDIGLRLSQNAFSSEFSVIGVSPGQTVLELRFGGIGQFPDREVPVTVSARRLSANVSPASAALETGQVVNLMCTVRRLRNGQTLPDEPVVWTSADPSIATVSASGTVTAIRLGTTTILCVPQGGGLVQQTGPGGQPTHTATIMVRPPPLAITISPANATLNAFSTAQFTCTVRHAVTGAAITGVPLTWTSSVPTVATVSANGLVTGVTPGPTLITCRAATGESASASVTVIAPVVRRVEVTPASATLNLGQTQQLVCTVRNAQTGAVIATCNGVMTTWSSSAPGVASVNSNGVVTGIAPGTATITSALQSGESGTAQVIVVAPADPLCNPQATPQANDLRQFVSVGFPNLPPNHYCMSSTSNLSTAPVLHSSNLIPPRPRVLDESSFFMVGGWEADLTTAGAAALGSTYPCGVHPGGRSLTLCKATAPLTAGTWYVMHMVLNGNLGFNDPPSNTLPQYQYGFVFDGDNNTTNNFRPSSSFPNDYFQGTDTWYMVTRGGSQVFQFTVLRVGSGNAPQVLPTNARMIMTSRALILMVPSADIPATTPGVRLTAFRHQGDFGLNGGPWAGDVQRPVNLPLYKLPIPR